MLHNFIQIKNFLSFDFNSDVKVTKNVAWLFLEKLYRSSVGILVVAWIANYLGPTNFGLLSFILAIFLVFNMFSGLGLRQIVVRQILNEPSAKYEILGTAAALQFLASIMSYIFMMSAIIYLRPDMLLAKMSSAILGAALIFKATEIAEYWFESQVQARYVVIAKTAGLSIFAFIKIWLIMSHSKFINFIIAFSLEIIFCSLIVILFFHFRGVALQKLKFSTRRGKELLRNSWPLLLSGGVLIIQARTDQLMLGQIVGDFAVAQYSVALRIAETVAVGATILGSSFMPSILENKNKSDAEYRISLFKYYRINALVGLVIAITIALFSGSIISFVFGDQYNHAIPILALMSLRIILGHVGVMRSVYLLCENLLTYSAITMIAGTLINIILNYWLIPHYGGIGATIASIVSFTVSTLVIDMFNYRTRANSFMMLRSHFKFSTRARV